MNIGDPGFRNDARNVERLLSASKKEKVDSVPIELPNGAKVR